LRQGRRRLLGCREAPTVRVSIERGAVVTAAEARGAPPGTIFLDGAAQGEPFLDPERAVYNLDHHEGCVRAFTLATCEQAFVLLRRRLDLRRRDWIVRANDADLDTVLAIWVLLNHLRLAEEGSRARVEILPLLRLEGCIDALGLEHEELCALPPELLARTRARLAALLRRERALRESGRWDRVDLLEYTAAQLAEIDRMVYSDAEIASPLEIEELARAEIEGGSLAVVCRADGGIYEVERELRRCHGERLGLVVLQKDTGTYSLRQVDASLPRGLARVYARLNLLDPGSDGSRSANRWGGSEEIGGSPRAAGSRMSPRQVAAACGEALSPPSVRRGLAGLARVALAAAACALAALALSDPPAALLERLPALGLLASPGPGGFAGVLFALAAAWLLGVGGRAPGAYGLRPPAGLDWCACLPLAAAGAAAGGVWIAQGPAASLAELRSPAHWIPLLVAPAAAECLFRGVVHGGLARVFPIQASGGPWRVSVPALLSSALYALWLALPGLAPTAASPLAAGPAPGLALAGGFAFGLAAALARERSESVLAALACHWLAVAGVLLAPRLF
jgi:membrane protease YdiL (CAAX protease family)